MDNAIGAIQNIAINSSEVTGSSATQHIDLPSAQQWQVNQQDAAAFEQALNSSPQTSQQLDQIAKVTDTGSTNQTPSFADDVLNKMQAMSASAAEKGELLERHIMKATQSLNPMDVVQANRMMSEYYLENLMTAKLVGNATKAVERLTSLN